MSALFALEIYLGSLFYGVFCTQKPPLRAWAHEKGQSRSLLSTFEAIMCGLFFRWLEVKGDKRSEQSKKNSVPVEIRWEKGAFFHKSPPTCGKPRGVLCNRDDSA